MLVIALVRFIIPTVKLARVPGPVLFYGKAVLFGKRDYVLFNESSVLFVLVVLVLLSDTVRSTSSAEVEADGKLER